jgi:surface protein
MADLFYAGYNALYKDELRSFNENLSLWDTRRVTTMSFMFSWTQAFNGNLSSWNVSQVEDMSYMFNYAYAFNGDVSSWDVSSVTDMSSMFSSASAFDGDVTSWDVSNVSDMADMFYQAEIFNRDVSSWDVAKVEDTSGMLFGAVAFNGDVSYWDVSSVTNMSYMFYGASSFNQSLCWNTTNADTNKMLFGSSGRFSSIPDPLCRPTDRPTINPTTRPSKRPSRRPSMRPSVKPSSPTAKPSAQGRILESTLYGTHSLDATEISRTCPDDSKIVHVNGKVGLWIYALYATCDDRLSTVLGPFGNADKGVEPKALPDCSGGYIGWQIEFGSYIGRLKLNCTNIPDSEANFIGAGEEDGTGSTGDKLLSENQRIVGFRTYYNNSSGIQAMKVLYAEIETVDPDRGGITGGDMLSFLWGVLAFSVPAMIAVFIIFYRQRQQHKQEFRALDRILPLK